MSEIPNGPHRLLLRTSDQTKIRTREALEQFHRIVKPLAECQSYISACDLWDGGEPIEWASEGFRGKGMWCPQCTLLSAKSYYLQMCKGYGAMIMGGDRWLHNIAPSSESKDRIVINRTGRYRNGYFPWQSIVDFYGDRLLFVGVPHEYRDFCGQFGMVEFRRTQNMLEAAELIAGSLLFIGNQSCANACAEGLKHPLIQETSLNIPDCIFRRSNAQHIANGACVLPGFGEPDCVLMSKIKPVIATNVIPPGYWEYPGQQADKILYMLVEKVAKAENIDTVSAKARILDYNCQIKPDFFKNRQSEAELFTFNTAYANAKL